MFNKYEFLDQNEHEAAQTELWKELSYYNPDDVHRVLSAPDCELEPGFLGFVHTYKVLSNLIPLDSVVVDFGCYAAAQAYYFRRHKLYIGVDTYSTKYRFKFNNTEHFEGTIQDWFNHDRSVVLRPTPEFAISNYVPQNYSNQTDKLIKERFTNLFIYYP